MTTYQQILCSVDYSPHSVAAAAHAVMIAEKFGAALTLVHVINLPSMVAETGISDDVIAIQKKQLETFAQENAPGHPLLQPYVLMGNVGEVLVETAESIGSDLIIMGSHGYSGIRQLLLGSTAEYILENCRIPTLIVRTS